MRLIVTTEIERWPRFIRLTVYIRSTLCPEKKRPSPKVQ